VNRSGGRPVFPFGDVVGQDDAKLALVLVAVDPRIGGVLLRGHKGSAKTTLARGLAGLLGDAPFVELPLGATEDRLVGTLDTEAALTGGGFRFRPGLLAEADGGVLYVDEINLLADHLVDTLLDVSVSGENVVERDGISHRHQARFVLVGSMNPEEGELRPQLLDRFGFCVAMTTPTDVASRVEAMRRRLAFDDRAVTDGPAMDGAAGRISGARPDAIPVTDRPSAAADVDGIAGRLDRARPATIPMEIMEAAARLSVEVGAEGLRADLTLCRGAAALAGLDGRDEATVADLRRIAPLALAHRSRRSPFDPPTMDPDELDRAMDESLGGPPAPDSGPPTDHPDPEDEVDGQEDADGGDPGDGSPAGGRDRPLVLGRARQAPTPAAPSAGSIRGLFVRDVPAPSGSGRTVAVAPTVRALAGRRASEPDAVLHADDLRAEERVAPRRRTIVLCVDLSGSMGASRRAEAATGTVLGLLADAYQRRDRVALVGFRGSGADVLLAPTSSIEVARNRLDGLVTGGATPLADGITTALRVATATSTDSGDALLVVLTDGRATGRPGAVDDAMAAAAAVRRQGVVSMVLDCETGPVRLGLAERLADAMGARYLEADALDPTVLTDSIRHLG
jgi:magnesium chelatase subunit D